MRGETRLHLVTEEPPGFPEVRCDRCSKVYALPTDQLGAAFLNGECPSCGHDRFSTVLPGGIITHEAFHGPEEAETLPLPETLVQTIADSSAAFQACIDLIRSRHGLFVAPSTLDAMERSHRRMCELATTLAGTL